MDKGNTGTKVDERDVSGQIRWLDRQRANVVITAMKRRHFNALYAATGEEARAAVLSLIPEGVSVFRADSVTLDQIEIMPALRRRNQNKIMWPQEKDGSGRTLIGDFTNNYEVLANAQRQAFFADVYLTGTNAVTLDGKLVSTDGGGNRVSAMIYGPKKVIVVAGVNKIVKDWDAALARIHDYCAPVNQKRHVEMHHRPWYATLPCVMDGACVDCDHERRVCNYTVMIEGSLPYYKDRINVILVGEDLGI
jgi:hypothetical protein